MYITKVLVECNMLKLKNMLLILFGCNLLLAIYATGNTKQQQQNQGRPWIADSRKVWRNFNGKLGRFWADQNKRNRFQYMPVAGVEGQKEQTEMCLELLEL